MEPHKKLGQQGERFAARWLRRRGFKIVASNVHAPGGELDLVVYNPRESLWILIEVKTRHRQDYISGLEAVGPAKQLKMQRAAVYYFLRVQKMREVPEFELHAIVLTPNFKRRWWEAAFQVEYYRDLS